jgi:stalled ribosome rescue protein Dom34
MIKTTGFTGKHHSIEWKRHQSISIMRKKHERKKINKIKIKAFKSD